MITVSPEDAEKKFHSTEQCFRETESDIKASREFIAKHKDALSKFTDWTCYGWSGRELRINLLYSRQQSAKEIAKLFGSHLIWDFPRKLVGLCNFWGCGYKKAVLMGLVCLCAMLGVMDCDSKESQIYQLGSSFPLGTFVPTIVHSAQKNPPPSNGTISPFEIEVSLPGSEMLIFVPATSSFGPVIFPTKNSLSCGILDRISVCSLFGNGGCGDLLCDSLHGVF